MRAGPKRWGRRSRALVLSCASPLLLAGAAAGQKPEPSGRPVTRETAREDPDLPGFLDGFLDKGLYLELRSQALEEYRGLPYAPPRTGPVNLRGAAIRRMEAQQRLRLRPDALVPLGLPPAAWEPVGPAPIPNGQTAVRIDAVTGRVTAIAVDPTDANVVYVGTAQGGVYRSLDRGASWTAIFDAAESLAIGALAVAPADPTILYVGTGEANLSGDSFLGVGLYRVDNAKTSADLVGPINPPVTFNGGTVVTGAFTGRSVSRIVVHPTERGTIFVATATAFGGLGATAFDAAYAVPPLGVLGVYRSTDADGPSPAFQKLSLGLATSSGSRLFASDPTSENSRVTDLALDPGNPNLLLAAVYGGPPQGGAGGEGGIYRSSNALAASPSFLRTLTLGPGMRVELASNRVGAVTTVFAATAESANFLGSSCTTGSGVVRRSVNGGLSWTRLSAGAGFCGGQCSYDIAVALDPGDASRVYLGGAANDVCSRIYVRSTDGGATFASADAGLHADTHAIAVAPSDPNVVYIGNDGGIWRSDDEGETWTSQNHGAFDATQFQSLALHPVDREFMIGGTQDNGTLLRREDATWFRADYGDGGFALIDQGATDTEDVTMYHTYFNQPTAMGFARVTSVSEAVDDGWTLFGCGFTGALPNGLNCSPPASSILFYAPLALGPGSPNTLYFGSDRLFRSTDRGETMALASQAPLQPGVAVSAIGIAPQDDRVRLVGMRLGRVFATADGSDTLVEVTGPWPTSASLASQPRRFVSRVVVDPTNSDVAYATFATYCAPAGAPAAGCAQVYKTTNLVTALRAAAAPAWAPAASGLPDVPVNAFVVDPRDPGRLFAGTDIGVYGSLDGGQSWAPFGVGLPRVAVFDLALHARSGTLRAATHGRGLWEIAVGNAAPTFEGLASPALLLGDTPTVLSGTLRAGSLVPPGAVDVTLNGITQSAALLPADGAFAASFDTAALPVGPHPIAYAFSGGGGYDPAFAAETLSVFAPTTVALIAPDAAYPSATVEVVVTSPGGTPAGEVTLEVDGGLPLPAPLVAGRATFTLPTLGTGAHTVRARYAAQGFFLAAEASGGLTVTMAPSAFSVGPVTIAEGQTPSHLSGTLRAGNASPSGPVEVTLAGVTLAAALDSATGAFAVPFDTAALAAGLYRVDFAHPGDANVQPAAASTTLLVTPAFEATTFANASGLTIAPGGPAVPSPSVVTVSGLFGTVLQARVALRGFTHPSPDAVSFLLVGPDGKTTSLLHRVGAGAGVDAVDLVFDDAGPLAPEPLVPGTYRPTHSGTPGPFTTPSTPGPDAPGEPYGLALFAQNGGLPNGDWRLYVQDEGSLAAGALLGGFELTLVTAREPGVSAADVTVSEGGIASVSVTLSDPPAWAVEVDYATAPDTAGAPGDFASVSGRLRFEPFETAKTVAVATVADGLGEAEERFFLDLAGASNARLLDPQAVVTIVDAEPHLRVDDVRVPEGDSGRSPLLFTIALDKAATVPLSVRYATVSRGAVEGRDYVRAGGVLHFAPGERSRTVGVSVLGDRVEEADEAFGLRLFEASPALYLERAEAEGVILNDDFSGPPRISINDAWVIEGDAGVRDLVFEVRLDRPTKRDLTVGWVTADGTARAGADYERTRRTVRIPRGKSSQTLTVRVLSDLLVEGDETLSVRLLPLRGLVALRAEALGTIVDDD